MRERRPDASALKSAVRSEINVTPLADVVLVLLIIFMLVTPLISRSVELPVTREGEGRPAPRLTVTLDAQDRLFVEGARTDEAHLIEALRAAPGGGSGVQLEADRRITYGRARRVLALLHDSGFGEVALAGVEAR